jgi:hypothetical protein
MFLLSRHLSLRVVPVDSRLLARLHAPFSGTNFCIDTPTPTEVSHGRRASIHLQFGCMFRLIHQDAEQLPDLIAIKLSNLSYS